MLRWTALVCASAAALGSGCFPRPAKQSAPLPPGSARNAAPAPSAERVVGLVELFDGARLLGDDRERALLWSGLGGDGGRGVEATRTAIDALAAEADRAGLADLAALLDDDREELDGGDARALAVHRKRVAASADPAARHALLSLYATCARALVDAADAPPWRRALIANRCLYPLYDADPEPYFARDPAARPPDPPWTRYFAGLHGLLDEVRRRAPRPDNLVARLGEALFRFIDTVDRDGIAPPDLAHLLPLLPVGDGELPAYDREPWVIVDGDMAVVGRARFGPRDHQLVERIDGVLALQRITGAPSHVALFVSVDNGADAIETLCMLARRGGADFVELVLSAPSLPPPPKGDVWAGQPLDRRPVTLPIELHATSGRDRPRALEAGPPMLTLLVGPDGLTVFATDGAVELGPIVSAADALARLRRAFPDEAQINLAIDPTASYRDVVTAALGARRGFRRLLLVDVPRRPARDELGARLRRRAAARFDIAGAPAIAARVELLRGCYLDALDRDPALTGTLTLRPGSPPFLDRTGPADAALRACLTKRAAALVMKAPAILRLAP